MRKALLATILVAALLAAFPAFAQSPNFDPGPVWRVTYYHIKPGQGDAFWKDFRENTKPIFEELKKAGFISDYKTFTNPVTDHPADWDVAVSISYPNYAALDQLAAKGATIVAKHFGSREAALESAKKLNDVREVIASHLAREVMSK
jgi:ABC-type sugar transport system substrate-binding protein